MNEVDKTFEALRLELLELAKTLAEIEKNVEDFRTAVEGLRK